MKISYQLGKEKKSKVNDQAQIQQQLQQSQQPQQQQQQQQQVKEKEFVELADTQEKAFEGR